MEFITSKGERVFVLYNWYVVEGGNLVNKAPDDTKWQDGIDVETIEDEDCYEWYESINSVEELLSTIEG